MSRIRGKKLTIAQHQILEREGIKDTENWLYVKTVTKCLDGSKSPSRNNNKITCMVFNHKDNGTLKEVEV